MKRVAGQAAVLVGLATFASGQMGDRKGEEQPPLPDSLEVPPAPLLSPDEALERFALQPGYRIELVAAEPLVQDPVVVRFDERGRMWVCEMRGYMPNIDGTDELEPNGVVAVLTDEDGDGRMDTREVFLDELVLPRAIHPFDGGCLILAPPELALWRDTDGDGRADSREVIDTGLAGLDNPEHAINGLLYQLDNSVRVANASKRYVRGPEGWRVERTAGGGQWGLTQDHLGRAYFNTNPDPVRGDVFPSHYAVRNPNHGRGRGGNSRFAHSFDTWPTRINTGVNRGYRKGTLRDDYTLRVFTAACGPWVQGDDVFVCEPAGNLVKRYRIDWKDDVDRAAVPVYQEAEFLTSTDERFRPVNLTEAPDGSLVVVDFYRGLIQHRIFLTSWLRAQILDRGLDGPASHGRIWRIVADDSAGVSRPALDEASWSELVGALSHDVAWWRYTAQRLLFEEAGDSRDAWELLRTHALEADEPLGRMHALWALDGTAGLDAEFVSRALDDPDPRVLHAAVRVAEPWIASGDPALTAKVAEVAGRGDSGLRLQGIHSLGSAATRAGDEWLAVFAQDDLASPMVRDGFVTGLYQRELAFVARLVGDAGFAEKRPGRPELLRSLARCVVRQGIATEVEALLQLALEANGWQQNAVFDGMLDARPKGREGKPAPVRLGASLPSAFALNDLANDKGGAVFAALVWPGKPGWEEEEVRPLTDDEEANYVRGAEIYRTICAACHQPSGLGEPGKAPPLRGSPYTLGDEGVFGRILLQGLTGELTMDGETWNAEMPAFNGSDADAAAVMTYVRREWGHTADPVDESAVRTLRESIADRTSPWTVEEIQALMENR